MKHLLVALLVGTILLAGPGGRIAAADAPPIIALTTGPEHGNRVVRLIPFDSRTHTLRVVVDEEVSGKIRFGQAAKAIGNAGGLAGCNGGFYNRRPFEPYALLISRGRMFRGLYTDPANWMHGIVAADAGRLGFIPITAFDPAHPPEEALQSGPWLVRNGQSETRLDQGRRARRTFVCRDNQTGWALGVADPCTFPELARMLLDPAIRAVIPIETALNLDGGSSCSLWSQDPASASLRIQSADSVHNYLALFPLTPTN